jgi:hypothetical protein
LLSNWRACSPAGVMPQTLSASSPRQRIDDSFLSVEASGTHDDDVGGDELPSQQRRQPCHFGKAVGDFGLNHQDIDVTLGARIAAGLRAEDRQLTAGWHGQLQVGNGLVDQRHDATLTERG